MIRDELFKEFEADYCHPHIEVEVSFEISDYEPRFAMAEGTIRLIMDIVDGAPCIIGVSNNEVWAIDQDGEELGEYADIKVILNHINTNDIEQDPYFDIDALPN